MVFNSYDLNTKVCDAGLYNKMTNLYKLPKYLPKWLLHFVFFPAMNENSFSSTPLEEFCVVSVFNFYHSKRC